MISTAGKHLPLSTGTVSSLCSIHSSNIKGLLLFEQFLIASLRSDSFVILNTSMLDPSSSGLRNKGLLRLKKRDLALMYSKLQMSLISVRQLKIVQIIIDLSYLKNVLSTKSLQCRCLTEDACQP